MPISKEELKRIIDNLPADEDGSVAPRLLARLAEYEGLSKEEMLEKSTPPKGRVIVVTTEGVHEAVSNTINDSIAEAKKHGALKSARDISDGYHTFGELYEFRAVLNIALFAQIAHQQHEIWLSRKEGTWCNPVWRSKLHNDGTMFDGMFIFGLFKGPGKQITFHYHLDKWDYCGFGETLDKAPEWDGHTPADVLERLKQL